ncbi:MAG: DUF2339 domain-containing protein [Pseudomonadota bacterium]|nr:DUF2339 domain-containing protein [Pseudomonadota bacterium]
MEQLFFFGGIFILFILFVYPVIVASIKVGGVRDQVHRAGEHVAALEHALAEMRARVTALEGQAPASAVPVTTPVPAPAPAKVVTPTVIVPDVVTPTVLQPKPMATAPPAETAPSGAVVFRRDPQPPEPAAPSLPPAVTPAWLLAVKTWLFTGNLVAKFGLLILIIGIGFLVTYLAQHVQTPIELRLAGVVALDIGLLLWGWRIRTTRRDVALPVQGAAMGIMMLVVFGAFARLQLIPAGLAFPLLVALTVFTCVLALLQDAIWLAVFGIAGGFVSTGSGNYIALFSYYALLNAGVLAIAWYRSWRALNLLGFVATFLICGAWGVRSYLPDNYASAQAFLILFFLFYVAIAVLWARLRAPQIKDAVDATLVFGAPAAGFAMQYGMVKETPFGLAFSALALGLFYICLAAFLQRPGKARANYSLLIASFVALAVVFGTLALPLALTGAWTSAAWALESAGLIWIGLRQNRAMAWRFGLLVQLGAWIEFVPTLASSEVAPMLLGAALLALAAGLTSWVFRSDDNRHRSLSHGLLACAGAWYGGPALWAAAVGLAQLIDPNLVSRMYDASAGALHVALYTVLVGASAMLALPATRRLAWPALRWFSITSWIALVLASGALLDTLYTAFAWPTAAQALAWAFTWLCGDFLLRHWQARPWPMAPLWCKALHLLRIGMPWLMLWPLFSRLIAGWLAVDSEQQDLLGEAGWRISGSWSHFVPAWLMMLAVFWLIARSRAGRWPVAPLAQWYRQFIVPAAACWFMLLALFWNLQQDGAMAPLPYLPVLNPLDLSTAFALLLWLASYRLWPQEVHQTAQQTAQQKTPRPPLVALMPRIAAIAAWGWLNMILVRTAAHFLGIDYNVSALADAVFIQAMLSLFWSLSALFVMRRAGKLAVDAARKLWMPGAALLGIVVVKLFIVDLSNTGSIARIVSFVGVGLMMVAIGYLAPYPVQPARSET